MPIILTILMIFISANCLYYRNIFRESACDLYEEYERTYSPQQKEAAEFANDVFWGVTFMGICSAIIYVTYIVDKFFI